MGGMTSGTGENSRLSSETTHDNRLHLCNENYAAVLLVSLKKM